MTVCASTLSKQFKISYDEAADVIDSLKDVSLEKLQALSPEGAKRQAFRLKSTQVARNYLYSRIPFFKDLMTGSSNDVYNKLYGFLENVARDQDGFKTNRMGRIFNALPFDRKLFSRKSSDKAFQEATVEEMLPFTGQQKSQNSEAFSFSENVYNEKKAQVFEANKYGAGMFWKDDHLTQQWHDQIRMVSAGKEKWVDYIYDRIDMEKSFDVRGNLLSDLTESGRKKYLRAVYDNITKNVDEFDWSQNVMNKSLGKRLQMTRHLQLKDKTAWLEYNKQFGHDNPVDAILAGMDVMDDRLVLMKAFGSNPKEAYRYLRRRMEGEKVFIDKAGIVREWKQSDLMDLEGQWRPFQHDKSPDSLDSAKVAALEPDEQLNVIYAKSAWNEMMENADAAKAKPVKLSGWQRDQLDSLWKQVSGEAYVVGRPSVAKFMRGLQSWLITTTMGKSMISSFGDVASVAVNLHSHGRGFLGSYSDIIGGIRARLDKIKSKAEREYVLNHMNVALEGILQETHSRYAFGEKLNRSAQKMFDVSGLNWWTNTWKEVWGRSMSMHLAHKLKSSWKDLDPILKKTLQEHRFKEQDWIELQSVGSFSIKERLKNNPNYKNVELGTERFITSDWIRQKIDGKKGERLGFMLDRFFQNEARAAVPTPDAMDRAFMMRTFQRGTVPAVVAQMIFTFRSHPVVMGRKVLPRMWEMGLPSLLHLTPMIGLGYASLAVKDLIKGKEPRRPDNLNTVLESLVQSGFAAGVGDFLLEEVGRHHSSFDETLLGPHYEFFKDIASLGKGLATGQDGAADAWNLIRERTPFMNLFYTELAYNYLVHYQVMETLQPGYTQMVENWSKGVDQQQYFDALRPTNFVSYGGPFR
tara:strand:+ start:22154 stop:24742 length:2589 start_codon:yes stop_codon:yes gene_type:complete